MKRDDFFIIKGFRTIVFIFIVCRTHSVTVIGVGSLSLGDNHLEVAGSVLTAGE